MKMFALLLLSAEPVEEITITSTFTPSSVARASVGREEIERSGEGLLPLAMKDVPGVAVQQTTRGQATTIIRGMIGSSVLTLVDGVRLNATIFRAAPNQYQALVDPFAVARIDVERGAGSERFGSDALGGVISIHSGAPRFESEELDFAGRVLGHFGTADGARALRAELDAGDKDAAVRLGATYQANGDLEGGGDVGRQTPTDFSAYSADARLALRGAARDFDLGLQFLRQPKTPRYDEVVAGFGQSEPSSEYFFFEPNQRAFAFARYTERDLLGIDRAVVLAGAQMIDDDRRSRDLGGTEETKEKNRDTSLSALIELDDRASELLEWMLGAEVVIERVASSRTVHDVRTGAIEALRGRFPDGASTLDAGVFGETRWTLSPAFRATAGARLTHFRRDTVDTSIDDTLLSGDASLAYRPSAALEAKLRIASAFRAPNVFDLSAIGPRPGDRFMIANADLGAERAYGVDLGLSALFDPLRFELVLFATLLRDRIESIPTGAADERGRELVQSMNLRKSRLLGAELASSLYLTDSLRLRGAITAMIGDDEGPGGVEEPTDRIPPPNGSAGLAWFGEDLELEVFARFALRQTRLSSRDKTDPRIDPNGTPGWLTLNARGEWRLAERVRLIAIVENALDEAYREHGSGVASPGAQLLATLEVTF